MAKGSVRKKGKKWYYRYYVEDASGNLVQKECVGTESKSETEKLLRKAMEEYESKKIVAKTENITLGELLDVWVDEELKVSSLSNNTVTLYLGVVKIIKRHPLSKRKLRTVTSEHMQEYMDYLSFGGTAPDGTEAKPLSIDRIHSFSAVLQRAFRYAVFPKQYISFNHMQYVVIRRPTQEVDLFATEDEDFSQEKTITHQQYNEIIAYLTKKKSSSLLAVQIVYYAGLRIGEVTGLSWDDINLEEQYLTVRRSLSRNNARHKLELGDLPSVKRSESWILAILSQKSYEGRKRNSTSNAFSTDSFIRGITTRKSEKRTEFTTNCIHWTEHRKCRRTTQRFLWCVSDRMECT